MELIRTLIVEDEYLVRMGLKMVIDWEAYGFTIVGEAKDGAEGLKLYQKQKPQLIITDIKMPVKSGLEMMQEIRSQDKEVKFIVISAYDQFEYAKQAIESGVLKYCLKGSMMDTGIIQILEEIKHVFTSNSEAESNYIRDFRGEEWKARFLKEKKIRCICISNTGEGRIQKMEEYLKRKEISYAYTLKHLYAYWIIGGNVEVNLQRVVMDLPLEKDTEYMGISTEFEFCEDHTKYRNEAYFANRIHVINHKNRNFYEDIPQAYDARGVIKEIKQVSDLLNMENYEEVIHQLEKIKKNILETGSVYLLHKAIYKLIGIIAEYNEQIMERALYEELIDLDDYNAIFARVTELVEKERSENLKNSEDRKYVKKVKNYIGQHYKENLKMKELADLIHLSPNYLGKIFYAETNYYIADYISNVRLEKAKMLLESRIYPVGEIGSMIGIGDPYYFSKLFKKRFGVSPREYIRSCDS